MFGGVDVEVMGVEGLRAVGRHEDDLTPAVARVCETAGVAPNELEQVAVSVGPGGFTALRMAVAAAKMIAAATGAKTISVPTATSVARGMREELRGRGGFAVALAGKQESAFVTVFAAEGEGGAVEAAEGRLMEAAEVGRLAAAGVRTIVGDRFLPEPIREAAVGAGMEVVPPRFEAAAVLECAALVGTAGVREVDPVELLPLYGREPEAVRLWRERKG